MADLGHLASSLEVHYIIRVTPMSNSLYLLADGSQMG